MISVHEPHHQQNSLFTTLSASADMISSTSPSPVRPSAPSTHQHNHSTNFLRLSPPSPTSNKKRSCSVITTLEPKGSLQNGHSKKRGVFSKSVEKLLKRHPKNIKQQEIEYLVVLKDMVSKDFQLLDIINYCTDINFYIIPPYYHNTRDPRLLFWNLDSDRRFIIQRIVENGKKLNDIDEISLSLILFGDGLDPIAFTFSKTVIEDSNLFNKTGDPTFDEKNDITGISKDKLIDLALGSGSELVDDIRDVLLYTFPLIMTKIDIVWEIERRASVGMEGELDKFSTEIMQMYNVQDNEKEVLEEIIGNQTPRSNTNKKSKSIFHSNDTKLKYILNYTVNEVAEQLIYYDCHIFNTLKIDDILLTEDHGLSLYKKQMNNITNFVENHTNTKKEFEFFVKVASVCVKLDDLNVAHLIYSTLKKNVSYESFVVGLSKEKKEIFHQITDWFHNNGNNPLYNDFLKQIIQSNHSTPRIPVMSFWFLELEREDYLSLYIDDLLNYEKLKGMSTQIKLVKVCQQHMYDIKSVTAFQDELSC
ncbi:Ras-GEF domain-containing protein [Entamoeba marina]